MSRTARSDVATSTELSQKYSSYDVYYPLYHKFVRTEYAGLGARVGPHQEVMLICRQQDHPC